MPSRGTKKSQKVQAARERDAVLVMRQLKAAEEELHELARRLEPARPERARILFDLSRQAFLLCDTMQRSWPGAAEGRRAQLIDAGQLLLRRIAEAS